MNKITHLILIILPFCATGQRCLDDYKSIELEKYLNNTDFIVFNDSIVQNGNIIISVDISTAIDSAINISNEYLHPNYIYSIRIISFDKYNKRHISIYNIDANNFLTSKYSSTQNNLNNLIFEKYRWLIGNWITSLDIKKLVAKGLCNFDYESNLYSIFFLIKLIPCQLN